jgi:hypothetical protein
VNSNKKEATMRQFLKSLFVGKRYIFVVRREADIDTTELRAAYPNAIFVHTSTPDPVNALIIREA